MKINNIRITNFRNHHLTKIEGLKTINWLVGPNGAGKTSVLDAIAYCLTGTCRGVDDGGRGADQLKTQIVGGPKSPSMVELDLGAGVKLIRAVGQGPKSQAHMIIRQVVGQDERVLKVLASPPNLLRLERKRQQELFMALVGAGVTVADVARVLTAELGVDLIDQSLAESLTTPAGRLLKLAYFKERRPEIKREIAGLVYVPIEGLPAADEIKRRRLQDEIRQLGTSAGQARSIRGEHDRQKRSLDEQAAALRRRAREIEDRKLVDDRLLPAEIEAIKQQLAARQDCEAGIAKNTGLRDDDFDASDKLTRQLNALRKLGDQCEACAQTIPEGYTAGKSSELGNEIAALRRRGLQAQNAIDAHRQRLDGLPSESALRDRLSRHERATGQADADSRQLEQIGAELEELEKKIEAHALVAMPSWEDYEKDAAAKAKEVELLVAAEREAGRRLQVTQQRQVKEKELEDCERMIEALGDGGPVAKLMMGGGATDLVATVRAIGERLGVGDIGIQLDPWQITLNGRAIELASASEEWRVAAAFAVAFAFKAKASIVLLDGAEILRGDNHDRLLAVVKDCGLEQIFVAVAIDEVPEHEDVAPLPNETITLVGRRADGVAVTAPLVAIGVVA